MVDEPDLRDLLTRAAPEFEPLDGAVIREGSRRPARRRVLLPLAAAAVVAAIGVTTALVARDPSSPAPGPAASTIAAPSPSGSVTATPDASAAFRLELVLPGTTFPANGQPIEATVVAINHTGEPVLIKDACNGWLGVGLQNNHASYTLLNGAVACASGKIRVGTTRYPTEIMTTYTQCQQGRGAGLPREPHCLRSGPSPMPNLPPGTYQAVVDTMSLSRQPAVPAPVRITLTPTR